MHIHVLRLRRLARDIAPKDLRGMVQQLITQRYDPHRHARLRARARELYHMNHSKGVQS